MTDYLGCTFVVLDLVDTFVALDSVGTSAFVVVVVVVVVVVDTFEVVVLGTGSIGTFETTIGVDLIDTSVVDLAGTFVVVVVVVTDLVDTSEVDFVGSYLTDTLVVDFADTSDVVVVVVDFLDYIACCYSDKTVVLDYKFHLLDLTPGFGCLVLYCSQLRLDFLAEMRVRVRRVSVVVEMAGALCLEVRFAIYLDLTKLRVACLLCRP